MSITRVIIADKLRYDVMRDIGVEYSGKATVAAAATAATDPTYFPWEEIIEWKGRPYDKMSFTSSVPPPLRTGRVLDIVARVFSRFGGSFS